MRKIFFIAVFAVSVSAIYCQTEMKSLWQTELEHKGEINEFDEASEQMMSTSEKMISLVETKTGTVKWTKD